MTKEAIDEIKPFLDAANVDLKFFKEGSYKEICKATLKPVLDSIAYMKEVGIWVEVTTLVIPCENDSDKELNDIAAFIAKTGKGIPWHISRFHPDYQYTKADATPIETIEKAMDIGKKNGLKYVYPGNVPTDLGTLCPDCGTELIKRTGFSALPTGEFKGGKCGKCGTRIEGIWQ